MITFSSHLYYWQALLAEGRFYSDLELTEKEIERMVMEASRLEYADGTFKQQLGRRESSTSSAEPSSSGASEFSVPVFLPPALPLSYRTR